MTEKKLNDILYFQVIKPYNTTQLFQKTAIQGELVKKFASIFHASCCCKHASQNVQDL